MSLLNRRISKLFQQEWPLVLAAIIVLYGLSLIPAVHHAILGADMAVARTANSLLGRVPAFDRTLGRLSTNRGDALVLGTLCTLFLVHSLRGGGRLEVIQRLAFWGWAGILCVVTYGLQSLTEYFLRRPIPVQAIPELHNLAKMYGLELRTHGFGAFPSGHAFAYIFFALMAWRVGYRRMAMLLGCLAVIMPGLRLVAGVHWLSDVVLGSVPEALLLAALAWNTPLLKLRGMLEQWLELSFQTLHGFKLSRPVLPDEPVCPVQLAEAPSGGRSGQPGQAGQDAADESRAA